MTSTSIDRFTGLASGLAYKAPCRAATTANITLSGEQTIDGIAVVADDRVLVKNQTDQTENGIYDVSATAWTRSLDFDGVRDVVNGTQVLVTAGTAAAGVQYQLTTANPITIGTSNITFSALAISGANANLTALGALNSSAGYLVQTAAATFTKRTLTGTSNQVVITNGDGTSGNPVFSLPQDIDTAASVTFGNLKLANAGEIRTATSAGNTLLIRAYDVDGASYTTFITLTANNIPSMAVTNATMTNSSINNTSIGLSTPAAGTFTVATANSFVPNASTVPTNGIYLDTELALAGGGHKVLRVYSNGSAVNSFTMLATNSGTGYVTLGTEGSDSDIGVLYQGKGTESHYFATGGGTQVIVTDTTSVKNSMTFTGGSSTTGVATIGLLGGGAGSTNCDIAITPKGTGLLKFGTVTSSSDVAITGYITIKSSSGATVKLATIA